MLIDEVLRSAASCATARPVQYSVRRAWSTAQFWTRKRGGQKELRHGTAETHTTHTHARAHTRTHAHTRARTHTHTPCVGSSIAALSCGMDQSGPICVKLACVFGSAWTSSIPALNCATCAAE